MSKYTLEQYLQSMKDDKESVIKDIANFYSEHPDDFEQVQIFMSEKKNSFNDKYFMNFPSDLNDMLEAKYFGFQTWVDYSEIVNYCRDLMDSFRA
ncbi:hypothetical protein K8089_10130 [Aequorivita sp. F47161]|uniref:Uncharacterized protein n=1 Tax=Aequorivita vitellina TaxID=2874475 RepID=A0A9X1QTW9_9FLAO|nr:hypothetical protein [Aequorivita vitellina]MCG2419381.1 hypothetical protein [Aequorivita vitellina]